MKGEVPQPGLIDGAALTERKARPYVNERKLARRKAFYETFLGKESFSSPEELPTSLFLPAQVLGDIQLAIQQTFEKGREYSQFIRWDQQRGFTPSRLYKGTKDHTSRWEALPYRWHDDAISSSLVALDYHTHPDLSYEYLWAPPYNGYDRFDHFSSIDIAHALYHNTPIHLVVTHNGIYGLVQTDMVARSASRKEVMQKLTTDPHAWAFDTFAGYTRGLHDLGFGLYQWQIPNDDLSYSRSSSVNWGRFFLTKEPQASDMRTQGITMTKLVTQPLEESSPAPETRVFGQL